MNRSREVRVGLLVIGSLAAFYLSIAWVQHRFPFSQPVQSYVIRFDQVNGLLKGDPVLWRGVPVGQVTQIKPEKDAVRVSISLEQTVPFLTDAHAELEVKELMGSKQIALFPGETGRVLPAGSEFPGTASMDFTSSFQKAGAVFNQFSPELLNSLGGLGDTLATVMRAWSAALPPEKVAALLQESQLALTRINRLIAATESHELVGKSDSLLLATQALILSGQETADQASRVLLSADTLMDDFRPSLKQLDLIATDTRALLQTISQSPALEMAQDEAFLRELQTTLSNLNGVLEQIQKEKIYVGFGRNKHKTIVE